MFLFYIFWPSLSSIVFKSFTAVWLLVFTRHSEILALSARRDNAIRSRLAANSIKSRKSWIIVARDILRRKKKEGTPNSFRKFEITVDEENKNLTYFLLSKLCVCNVTTVLNFFLVPNIRNFDPRSLKLLVV